MKEQTTMGAKISGELIGTFNGLRIYGRLSRAKKKGKDRLWIHIRQPSEKNWRIAATLSYANSMDVRFESVGPTIPTESAG
jgi:hypothetical protein